MQPESPIRPDTWECLLTLLEPEMAFAGSRDGWCGAMVKDVRHRMAHPKPPAPGLSGLYERSLGSLALIAEQALKNGKSGWWMELYDQQLVTTITVKRIPSGYSRRRR